MSEELRAYREACFAIARKWLEENPHHAPKGLIQWNPEDPTDPVDAYFRYPKREG